MERISLLVARSFLTVALLIAGVGVARSHDGGSEEHHADEWSVNASIIEATSGSPDCAQGVADATVTSRSSSPDGSRPCLYNRAVKVNSGHVGTVVLDGVRFWMAGARGTTTGTNQQEWGDIVFDPTVTVDQRAATLTVLSHLYPVEWLSFSVIGTPREVSWEVASDRARARLADGKVGEISLNNMSGSTGALTTAFRYAAAPRASGVMQMEGGSHAYKRGAAAFRATETAGVVVTVDMSSSDLSH